MNQLKELLSRLPGLEIRFLKFEFVDTPVSVPLIISTIVVFVLIRIRVVQTKFDRITSLVFARRATLQHRRNFNLLVSPCSLVQRLPINLRACHGI